MVNNNKVNNHFKWHKESELYGLNKTYYDPSYPASWFTIASFFHFVFGIFAFLTIKTLFRISDLNNIIIVNICHIIEDYLENRSLISVENIYNNFFKCTNRLFLSTSDKDSIQNFIGDNISCFLGTLLGYYLIKYKYVKTLNNSLILFIWIFMVITPGVTCYLWKDKIEEILNKNIN